MINGTILILKLPVKYNICLKPLLQQSISEPVFYGDLVYKFKRIVGKLSFSDRFKKIIKRYKRVGYNMDIMRPSACLVVNPITVYSYDFLLNCMMMGQAPSPNAISVCTSYFHSSFYY